VNRARGHRAAKRRRVIAGGSLFALVAIVAVAGLIFSGVTQAAPSDPTTVGADTVSSIALNGNPGTTITVAPGTDVSISANWSDAGNGSCPDCIDYLDVGFPGHAAPAGCLENDVIDAGTTQSGSGSADLGDAPSTPGTYDIVAKYDEEYTCGELWDLGAGGVVIAEITVLGPPSAAISSPADGQTFGIGQSVATSFSCSEAVGGPGISSCVDGSGGTSPGALDTSKAGSFEYTVTATSSDGQVGMASIHYTVAGPPTATISSPADGQTYNLGQNVATSFSCLDSVDGPGLSGCVDSNGSSGPAGALVTSAAGTFAYSVTATSKDGQSSTVTIHYTVLGSPSAAITSPADGQTFNVGASVPTGFSCVDALGAPGIASCVDSNGSSGPAGALVTSSAGTFAYVVTATSSDGQTATATIHYTVVGPPTATIGSPVTGQTYNLGQHVATSFSCQDSAGAPGISSCVDSNASTSPGALVTSAAGTFAYSATATSTDGQTTTSTIHYTVLGPPSATIGSPADGQTYNIGAIVPTSFSCSDAAGAPGISSCVDSNGSTSPGALVTSSAGTFAYSVTATSSDGQTATATIHYTVLGPPTATIGSPVTGQTYNLGQHVATSFSCQDSTNAPGIASCVDSNGGTSPAGALNTSQAGTFAYVVTATSTDGQTGTATINYTVLGPPAAVIGSPADAQTYNLGASVATSFSCSDAAGAPGISSCVDSNGSVSPGALVTSSAGTFAYSVTATSSDGQTTTSTIHYTVLGLPSATISSPADGQTFDVGASVATSFSCADAPGGPGIASCVDSNGSTSPGAPDTSKAGTFAYTVTATSTDGQSSTSTIHYTVVDPPSATIASPGDGLTYTVGQQVATSFSCTDAVNAPGIASCVDSNGSPSPAGALNTSQAGTFTYVVTAKSGDGQTTTTTIHYTVAPLAPSLIVPLPFAVLGTSTDVTPVSGTVTVKLPGSSTFTTLSSTANIPVGSTIDALSGTVSLTVTLPDGSSQTGQFYNGVFVFTQTAGGTVIATLTGASFTDCPPPTHGVRADAHAASGKKKPTTVIRQLWGNGHGKYTTKGRYGSASVSGTIWVTEDLCDGTLIKAIKDNVIVVSFAHPHIKHNVRQGQSFFIPAPGY